MNKLVIAAALIASVPVVAIADCRHYEYAELQGFSSKELQSEYCSNALDVKIQKNGLSSAREIGVIQRESGMTAARIAKTDALEDEHYKKLTACLAEQTRISRLLKTRKVNMSSLEKKCPLE